VDVQIDLETRALKILSVLNKEGSELLFFGIRLPVLLR